MNRKECREAIETIDAYVNGYVLKENPTKYEAKKAILVIDDLITEHFELVEYMDLIAEHLNNDSLDWIEENPPLKFEDLELDMWVWDNVEKMYGKVIKKEMWQHGLLRTKGYYWGAWEENRYYLREVKE